MVGVNSKETTASVVTAMHLVVVDVVHISCIVTVATYIQTM